MAEKHRERGEPALWPRRFAKHFEVCFQEDPIAYGDSTELTKSQIKFVNANTDLGYCSSGYRSSACKFTRPLLCKLLSRRGDVFEPKFSNLSIQFTASSPIYILCNPPFRPPTRFQTTENRITNALFLLDTIA